MIDSVVSDGQYSLTIYDVTLSDAGQYTVTATSPFGKCQCTATVLVQGLSRSSVLPSVVFRSQTRKLCCRKDDRAMRLIYECPESF